MRKKKLCNGLFLKIDEINDDGAEALFVSSKKVNEIIISEHLDYDKKIVALSHEIIHYLKRKGYLKRFNDEKLACKVHKIFERALSSLKDKGVYETDRSSRP